MTREELAKIAEIHGFKIVTFWESNGTIISDITDGRDVFRLSYSLLWRFATLQMLSDVCVLDSWDIASWFWEK